MSALVASIKEAAQRLGFAVVGIASVASLLDDDQAFQAWCEAGFAADMNYLTRRTALHAHPQRLVPQAASIITLAVNYYAPAPTFQHENRYGRVARYAWGLDYHDVVKARLIELAAHLEKLAGRKIQARCFVDAVPLLERAVAASAGVGFFGKNTNLLQGQKGSWFFLAEILVDVELPADRRALKISCGTCHRCLDACPTQAFAAAYQLDSRRCISYLTIENKGAIPVALREGLGEWLFGCDVCQEVCPFNRFSAETAWPEFQVQAGAGQRLDLVEVLALSSDEEFRARFQATPLRRPKRRGLLRNAAIVAANVECTAAVPVLLERVTTDAEPLIRSHALWALARLDRPQARALIERALKDADALVREEAASLLADFSHWL
ncbi:MAG: tRNA epoxyqueuosine(34) reductase QueG [Acidobacteria bacterium]|nr:tRNA epoxyqueuosine(34) reductase QueG [Acidobacteriota bacterium]